LYTGEVLPDVDGTAAPLIQCAMVFMSFPRSNY
jgi:hypothetical protein